MRQRNPLNCVVNCRGDPNAPARARRRPDMRRGVLSRHRERCQSRRARPDGVCRATCRQQAMKASKMCASGTAPTASAPTPAAAPARDAACTGAADRNIARFKGTVVLLRKARLTEHLPYPVETPIRLIHPSTTATRLAEGTVAVDEAWISRLRRCRPIGTSPRSKSPMGRGDPSLALRSFGDPSGSD